MKIVCLVLTLAVLTSCSQQKESRPAAEPAKTDLTKVRLAMNVDAARNLNLKFGPPEPISVAEPWRVTGNVQPVDSRVTHLRPLARGRIIAVLGRIGDHVTAGQALVRYDNIEAGELRAQHGAAAAELQRMKVQLAAMGRVVERNRNLLRLGAVAAKDLELAEAEQRSVEEQIKAQESVLAGIAAKLQRFGLTVAGPEQAAESVIRAPFDGLIIEQNASVGEAIDTADVLFALADTRELWIQADVYEKDLGRLALSSKAEISTAAYPDRRFPVRVSYIGDQVDAATRTVRVRCEFQNPQGLLKIGMFVWVDLPRAEGRTGLSVPVDAVQDLDGKPVVFVRGADGSVEPRAVATGAVTSGRIAVLSGVSPDDQVALAGAFHLKSMVLSQGGGE